MARNDEGEFELMLGNRQLLSVFFLMVLLLGLCFAGGYMLGRNAAPVLNAANVGPVESAKAPLVIPSAPVETVKNTTPEPPPTKTASQVPVDPPPVKETPKEAPKPVSEKAKVVAKVEPPAAKQPPVAKAPLPPAKSVLPPVATKQPPIGSKPIPGRVYLQLTATDQVKAETIADLLRSKSFPGIAAQIPEKPGVYRVLVGPLAETALNDTKAKLKGAGFPADGAFKQVFR
ncbi:MAG: hypothetical protein ABI995_03410 [Acidobacteriota bacterium]